MFSWMTGWMRQPFGAGVVALALAMSLAGAAHTQSNSPSGQAPIVALAKTTWAVDASWSNHRFFWVFGDNGRYTDTDGPTGSWTQDGNSLTLVSSGGYVYRVNLAGDTASGTVYGSDGAKAGTLKAQRVVN